MQIITEKKAKLTLTNGFTHYHIQAKGTMNVTLEADKGTSSELFITYDGIQADLHIRVKTKADCDVKILFWNHISEQLSFYLDMDDINNSKLHIGIADLQHCVADYTLQGRLCVADARVQITTACLAYRKHWLMNMHHHGAHTHSVMNNFAVVETNGDYRIEAGGIIQKGAYESSTHQQSRVLTMSENQQSEVLPILLIDENEVKASHATTLGQPDHNQLYYLQSRGLTYRQALGLLKLGYLLPICEVLSDADMQKQLQTQIEEKVMNHD